MDAVLFDSTTLMAERGEAHPTLTDCGGAARTKVLNFWGLKESTGVGTILSSWIVRGEYSASPGAGEPPVWRFAFSKLSPMILDFRSPFSCASSCLNSELSKISVATVVDDALPKFPRCSTVRSSLDFPASPPSQRLRRDGGCEYKWSRDELELLHKGDDSRGEVHAPYAYCGLLVRGTGPPGLVRCNPWHSGIGVLSMVAVVK